MSMSFMYEKLSEVSGKSLDQIRFICHILYTIPFSLVNYHIKCPTKRLIFGLVTGISLCFNMYGIDVYHLIIDSLVTHFFIVNYGRKISAFAILIFTLIHISYVHIERMYTDYGGWSLDISGIYMMTVVKFSAYAFSYEDGGKDDSEFRNEYMKSK